MYPSKTNKWLDAALVNLCFQSWQLKAHTVSVQGAKDTDALANVKAKLPRDTDALDNVWA